ncbi:AMP-binding protein [Xenorhabdus sp. ZM]|uniref:AMP-binding protein n=1 Tax=Xenorhabdus szentirmaii TaxID=290112 RepID=UPI0019BEF327|nr:AMP-binding protein [Xenorhabdus sp. ZM]MBD2807065.1 AMP-binding protein [Xenorhabdus sp. ZM]
MSLLLDNFWECVTSHGDYPAIKENEMEITYSSLQAKANSVTITLMAQGVQGGDSVILGLEPSINAIAAMIGIMQLGAAYVPIDMRAPIERNLLIIADCKPKLALFQNKDLLHFGRLCPSFDIETLLNETTDSNSKLSPIINSPEEVCYIIYTSGTTGKPKGVPISQENLYALLAATEEKFKFATNDRSVLYHSMAFDFSVWEIWTMLAYGGCLYIPNLNQRLNAEAFSNFLSDNKITFLNQTPTSFRLNAPFIISLGQKRSSLRAVVFGGERLDMGLLRDWSKEFSLDTVAMINMYGITETTIHSSYFRIHDSDLTRIDSPIGKILNSLKYIIREFDGTHHDRIGELLLSGLQVTKGYFKNPDLTTERFVMLNEQLYYCTGDLVYNSLDGNLIYCGRLDDQLSINDHRVETGEIISTFVYGGCENELTILPQQSEFGPLLVCYFVASHAEEKKIRQELRCIANERLPVYMRPNKYIRVKKYQEL